MDSSIKTFNASSTLLFITVLLAGFYGGTGFFVVLGGNPAIQKMSAATFTEYWQHTDFYMAARMKFFGPLLLLCLVGSTALLYFQNNFISCGLMFAALVVLTADLFVIFNFNHPLNRLIQSWDLNQLPDNVQVVKQKVVGAFWIRSFCMMGSFALTVLAIWKRG